MFLTLLCNKVYLKYFARKKQTNCANFGGIEISFLRVAKFHKTFYENLFKVRNIIFCRDRSNTRTLTVFLVFGIDSIFFTKSWILSTNKGIISSIGAEQLNASNISIWYYKMPFEDNELFLKSSGSLSASYTCTILKM